MRTPILLAAAALSLCACNGGDDDYNAEFRVLNVSTGYASIDVYTNSDNNEDADARQVADVQAGTVSDYVEIHNDNYSIKFKRNGVSSTLYTLSAQDLVTDSRTTFVAFGESGSFSAVAIDEDQAKPASGHSKLNVVNTSGAGALDVYLTDETVDLDDATPDFASVATGASGFGTISSATWRLRITGAGDPTDVRLDIADFTLDDQDIGSLVLTPTAGGVLVDALYLPQQGGIEEHTNTKSRVRGAAGVSGGVATTLQVGDSVLLANAGLGAIGSKYALVEAGTLDVTVRAGGSVVPADPAELEAGHDYTVLVWNDEAGVRTSVLGDDNRYPSTGSSKLRIVNGMSSFAGPVTFSLDYVPIAEGVELGAGSGYEQVTSGSDFQLDVTGSLTAEALLTRSGITLQSDGVYTMFVSGGGSATITGTLRKDR